MDAITHPLPTHPKFRNITGLRFGRLVAEQYRGVSANFKSLWLCRCECGAETVVKSNGLLTGKTRSCGCLHRETSARQCKREDLTGQRFGRWVVVEFGDLRGTHKFWRCKCDCGTEKAVDGKSLKRGISESCGCLRSEIASERATRRMTRHGAAKTGEITPEYCAWSAMIERCRNPNHVQYHDYGGRGIGVCERWMAFENFIADMGLRPSRRHSIDRIENSGGYEPGNCQWATKQEQERNKRTNRIIEFMGESHPLVVWCERLDMNYHCVLGRLRLGWSVADSLTTPANKYAGTQ